ncbi:uncharacterized protein LOC120268468 [Dioscorea cayenensis subsp. rotundata]|uniref:Uncharacterized protein LOC120268468 n=1 Tax=Dioscorea cayennensis subsp. rotundata TaxID=55577 RepID=A0AB40BWH9_DIOCR|nr:uncharacterized protein LOC120268468 [Dioscorea cayenensis subsp. rotundata]
MVVASGSSRVLVNGIPTRRFSRGKRLMQGDPLATFFFILVADSLTRFLHRARQAGRFRIKHNQSTEILISQFADDTLIFGNCVKDQVLAFKCILLGFEAVSGLSINFSKSSVFYLGGRREAEAELSIWLNCKVGVFPFKYLGIPISPNRLTRREWMYVKEKFDQRLACWKGSCLSLRGRLVLTNSVLSSLAIHFMAFFKLPKWLVQDLDRVRSRFIWRCKRVESYELG